MNDDLKPGLELDKLIAEKVLGWYQDSVVGGPRDWWYEKGIESKTLYLNHYSTDIKAAWDLVEKFKLCVMPWAGQWMVYRHTKKYIAPTAPHAICLAALNWAEIRRESVEHLDIGFGCRVIFDGNSIGCHMYRNFEDNMQDALDALGKAVGCYLSKEELIADGGRIERYRLIEANE